MDALLNLVGELVINRTRISDIANTLERLMADKASNAGGASSGIIAPLAKDLADSAALLARTTNEIQESIMKVRMVPIGQVFDRFPRLVRDVAKARGKEVQLVISGAETDLDKTIVDEVGEPLMHLLRNNVDHGIEPPDEREKLGKARVGTISLNAYHEGNQIIIEVSDDGGGINLEKVRARGVKQGLISADDRLSDREIIELIFTPGFSTADVVSDVSGRGVGMDVVKRNISRLKGVFDVDTTPGQGTRFTIKLPLTLAIIQALLVRVGEELYAIPLDSVIESQRVEMPDVRTVHGNEVITLRGQVVPLVRIAEFFELGGSARPGQGDDRHRGTAGAPSRAGGRSVRGRARDRHQAALRRGRQNCGHLGRDDSRQRIDLADHRRALAGGRSLRRRKSGSRRILGSLRNAHGRR